MSKTSSKTGYKKVLQVLRSDDKPKIHQRETNLTPNVAGFWTMLNKYVAVVPFTHLNIEFMERNTNLIQVSQLSIGLVRCIMFGPWFFENGRPCLLQLCIDMEDDKIYLFVFIIICNKI